MLILACSLFYVGAIANTTDQNNNTKETKVKSSFVKTINQEDFKKLVFDYSIQAQTAADIKFKGNKATIVDFYADWCRPCIMLSPILDRLSVKYEGKVDFYKVDVDDNKEISSVLQISSIPFMFFVSNEGKIGAQPGMLNEAQLTQIIEEHLLKPSEAKKCADPNCKSTKCGGQKSGVAEGAEKEVAEKGSGAKGSEEDKSGKKKKTKVKKSDKKGSDKKGSVEDKSEVKEGEKSNKEK